MMPSAALLPTSITEYTESAEKERKSAKFKADIVFSSLENDHKVRK